MDSAVNKDKHTSMNKWEILLYVACLVAAMYLIIWFHDSSPHLVS
jgi:hypothetical protein